MVEAVRTYASPAGIWAIVIVAVALLAFWLTAVMLADRSQVRASGQSRLLGTTGPTHDDALTGESRAGEEAAEVPGEPVHGSVEARGRHAREEQVPQGDTPTLADLPAQPGGQEAMPAPPTGRHAMPAQRTGDTDRAERSHAGSAADDDEAERG